MSDLYHFTCEHGAAGIATTNTVIPTWHPFLLAAISWWTDLRNPSADEVGLTSSMLSCDRLAHRFRAVTTEDIRPWLGSKEQANTFPWIQADLQRYGDPHHWWIANDPIRVEADDD